MAEKKPSPPCKEYLSEDTRKHLKKARKEMRKSVKALFPPEFLEHRQAARKEMLRAARGMIDAAIEHIEN
ncbi:MAG: hypothetical protein H8E28_13760 [Anaerolineae bacterium]|nr:hypothetical protein [Anaerolineae bacterium]